MTQRFVSNGRWDSVCLSCSLCFISTKFSLLGSFSRIVGRHKSRHKEKKEKKIKRKKKRANTGWSRDCSPSTTDILQRRHQEFQRPKDTGPRPHIKIFGRRTEFYVIKRAFPDTLSSEIFDKSNLYDCL